VFPTKVRLASWALTALAAAALSLPAPARAQSNAADLRAQYLKDVETMQSKFLDLAGAMDDGMYTWRPMDGVRSVSEVFMLIAAENYFVPTVWGTPAPAGVTVDRTTFQTMAKVTTKTDVLKHLRDSFTYTHDAVAALTDEQLASTVQFFGGERSVQEALYLILSDQHEHLGQAIAYARTNHVVPPWTARGGQ